MDVEGESIVLATNALGGLVKEGTCLEGGGGMVHAL